MEYYRFVDVEGELFVRINHADYSAECFDDLKRTWVRLDAYYDEIVFNGRGTEVTEAEALTAIKQVLTMV
jgi:hypothetical protein